MTTATFAPRLVVEEPTFAELMAQRARAFSAAVKKTARTVWSWLKTKASLGWSKLTGAATWCAAKAASSWRWLATNVPAAVKTTAAVVASGAVRASTAIWASGRWLVAVPLKWALLVPYRIVSGLLIGAGLGVSAIALLSVKMLVLLVLFPVVVAMAIAGRFVSPASTDVVEVATDEEVDGVAVIPDDSAPHYEFSAENRQQLATWLHTHSETNEDVSGQDKALFSQTAGRMFVLDRLLRGQTEVLSATELYNMFRTLMLTSLDKRTYDQAYTRAQVIKGITDQLADVTLINEPVSVQT